MGGNRSKGRDRKSELVLRSTYQIFEWDRNNSDRNFFNVVRYVHIPLVPKMQERSGATCHMAMPQCCYLAKGAKRPSHTTNMIKFDRIRFDRCNSIKSFDLFPFDQKNSTYLQPPGDSHPLEVGEALSLSLARTKSLRCSASSSRRGCTCSTWRSAWRTS